MIFGLDQGLAQVFGAFIALIGTIAGATVLAVVEFRKGRKENAEQHAENKAAAQAGFERLDAKLDLTREEVTTGFDKVARQLGEHDDRLIDLERRRKARHRDMGEGA